MNLDDELDMLLVHDSAEDEMQNHAFLDTVMARIRQQRKRRRAMLSLTGSLASIGVVMAWVALPLPAWSGAPVDVRSILALLVLAAVSSMTWLRADNRSHTT